MLTAGQGGLGVGRANPSPFSSSPAVLRRAAGVRLGEKARRRKETHGLWEGALPHHSPGCEQAMPWLSTALGPPSSRSSTFSRVPTSPQEIHSHLTPWLVGSTRERASEAPCGPGRLFGKRSSTQKSSAALCLDSAEVPALLPHTGSCQE